MEANLVRDFITVGSRRFDVWRRRLNSVIGEVIRVCQSQLKGHVSSRL